MKKKLFVILFIFLLWGIMGFAQSSSVTVTPITANYTSSPPTVTFKVSWPAGTRDANHRSKVWLLVDYKRIKDNAYTGGWLRAGISSAHTPTTTAGSTVSLDPGNTKGFWLQGTDGAFAATVTVPVTVNLTGYAPQFGWCGVASDRPPYAEEKTGSYTLHGTPDFIIQTHPTDASQTVTEHTTAYNDCIYALTDATGAPGDTPLPAITDFTASTTTICKGGSVTLTASASNAASYSFNNGAWSSSSTTVVSPTSTTAYTFKVRSAGGCTVTSSKTITVTVNDPPTGLSLTSATICNGESVTLTATPAGAASYRLDNTSWQSAATFEVKPETTSTYTLYIKSAEGCTATKANAGTVTVNAPPTISHVSGSGSPTQTVNVNSAISAIKFYATNASSITRSGALPAGVSASYSANTFTIYGAPTATGTSAYTVTTTNSNGCTDASLSGTIITYTGCNPSTLTLTGVGFANSNSYTRNGITISAPVTVTTCQKTTYAGGSSGSNNADCRTNPGYDGDVFSWCMVVQHAAQLCPSPWRVPTSNDFCSYAGFATECTSSTTDLKAGMEGWMRGGHVKADGTWASLEQYGDYWSIEEYDQDYGYYIYVTSDRFQTRRQHTKNRGFTLRCVR